MVKDKEEVLQYVIHTKLDPTKKYLCLVNPYVVNLEDLENKDNFKCGIPIVRVRCDIDNALRFVEIPENVVGIATEKGDRWQTHSTLRK